MKMKNYNAILLSKEEVQEAISEYLRSHSINLITYKDDIKLRSKKRLYLVDINKNGNKLKV